MEEALKNKSIIEIDMLPKWDKIYCGICLLINDQAILMLNFNDESGEFDGYTLLKSDDLSKYRIWELDEYSELKNDNREQFLSIVNIEDYSDLKTAFSNLTDELISIFTYDNTESYFVGKIEEINKNSILLKLINESSEWIETEKFDFDEISYIGFRTGYELELMNKVL